MGAEPATLRARVVDAFDQPVGASGFLADDGTWTLEVAAPQAGQEYYVRVSVDTNSAVDVGNYVASAEFTTPTSQMNDVVDGEVSSSMDEFFRWSAAKTKLFRFDLSTTGASKDEVVKLTIYDAHSKEMRLVLASPSGVTRTGYAWLIEGDYILRFTATSRTGASIDNVGFSLSADGISDDQDTDGSDPDDSGDNDPYNYNYYYYNPGSDLPDDYAYEYYYDYYSYT